MYDGGDGIMRLSLALQQFSDAVTELLSTPQPDP
jgi:hypothetical protein